MGVRIIQGDCRDVLKTLRSESVHCVVTSPPYWGLRDYGVAGQLGLEPTIEAYVETMVAVFREVRRVLRKDGTLWLNLGDSYAANYGTCNSLHPNGDASYQSIDKRSASGLKPKDLCGIPWRVAFALQADGWYLRSDIIWSKPNPMPESVTDRPTKAHEYLFLLSKSASYFYDAEAIKEPLEPKTFTTFGIEHRPQGNDALGNVKSDNWGSTVKAREPKIWSDGNMGRNKRSVWEIATAPFPDAHFATFPPALVEPCIRAGTSEKGCCAKCGAPWVRDTEVSYVKSDNVHSRKGQKTNGRDDLGKGAAAAWNEVEALAKQVKTLSWSPSCSCSIWPNPCTVLDPFGGAGTTGMVADRLGRNAILIELSPSYAAMAERRIKGDAGLFAAVENRIAAE